MKTSKYMNINRIEVTLTYQCSGKCKHCSVGDKLRNVDGHCHVMVKYACEAIKSLSKTHNVTSVMIFGGEPLLFSETVCDIYNCATSCGIETRQLITNGYFTKNEEQCKKVAKRLAESGLSDLLISVDAFHQEIIPLESVYSFAKNSKDIIPNVNLHPAWVVNENHDNPYNKKTKQILDKFSDLEIPTSNGNNIFMAGRATEYLSEYYDKPCLDLLDTCGSLPYTQALDDVTSLSIAPNGEVMICNFVIGNIYKENIDDIISRYDPYSNEWMNAILIGGASKLLKLSREHGIYIDTSQCYSVCDLCNKISNAKAKGID